jgi:hypothetical protein
MEKSTIAFAPLKGSGNHPVKSGEIPTKTLDEFMETSGYALYLLIAYIAIFAAIYFLLYQPWIEDQFDKDEYPESYYYTIARVAYLFATMSMYYFVLLPLLGYRNV